MQREQNMWDVKNVYKFTFVKTKGANPEWTIHRHMQHWT